MIYLFGSRAPGSPRPPRPDSDIDVFVETKEDLEQIPPSLLLCNGGPVDAFWPPDADGWALAVGDEDAEEPRMILCRDRRGSTVHPVPVSAEEVVTLAEALEQ